MGGITEQQSADRERLIRVVQIIGDAIIEDDVRSRHQVAVDVDSGVRGIGAIKRNDSNDVGPYKRSWIWKRGYRAGWWH